jgi:ferrous iron transport protein A
VGENDFHHHLDGVPLMSPMPLADLPPGTPARLCAPSNGAVIPRRLQDLGFVPGTPLTVVRRAPLGDPVEIELRGYRLCLRVAQLDALRVVTDGGNGTGPR